MFTMLGVNYIDTHTYTHDHQQIHTEIYNIKIQFFGWKGLGGKNGWNKRSLLYFLKKKRSFEKSVDVLFDCTGI